MNISEAGEVFGRYQRSTVLTGLLGFCTIVSGCDRYRSTTSSLPEQGKTTTEQTATTTPFTFSYNDPKIREQLVLPGGELHQETGNLEIRINPNTLLYDSSFGVVVHGSRDFMADLDLAKDPKERLIMHLSTCIGYSSEQRPRNCARGEMANQDWTNTHALQVFWTNWNITQVIWDGRHFQILRQDVK